MVLKKRSDIVASEGASTSSVVSSHTRSKSASLQLYEDEKFLPYRTRGNTANNNTASITIHSVPQQDGLIISITPPEQPVRPVAHMPCDIVLVIDVSGSMDAAAPAPGGSENSSKEDNGLSVLDLTKHAARTILHTLNKDDRLAIVTFSNNANVLLDLTSMTDANKRAATRQIAAMKPESATNLWHGLTAAIKLFDDKSRPESVPAIMVLTDGQPNFMCPAQGYVPKLRAMNIPATIHTFGFGYSIRSGLLKSIAEIGGGSYAFIPDAGMIGTVFVHALANLQSTFATDAVLTISSQVPLQEAMGSSVKQELPIMLDSNQPAQVTTIHLGNIQYGQSREIFMKFDGSPQLVVCPMAEARLRYTTVIGGDSKCNNYFHDLARDPDLPAEMVAYHRTRAQICSFLSSFFPIKDNGEHISDASKVPEASTAAVTELIQAVEALGPGIAPEPLLADLRGQIAMALSQAGYFHKWGAHYLPSLLSSHTSQACNSFKDPGPLEYGKASPLFVQCRDALDAAFDSLPPPKPSRRRYQSGPGGGAHSHAVNMRHYNRSSNPCFAGSCKVTLSCGRDIPLRRLRAGMSVATPAGPRKVAAVLKTRAAAAAAASSDSGEGGGTDMCRIDSSLLVTPYHPISLDGGRTWEFPIDVAQGVTRVCGRRRPFSVYSVLLQPDADARAHGIYVGGYLGVTLGHGVVKGRQDDVRNHAFFGDYGRVVASMKRLRKDRHGVTIGNGVRRHGAAGLVAGFRPTLRAVRRQ